MDSLSNCENASKKISTIDALLVQLSTNPYFDMLSSYTVGQLGLYYLAGYADRFGYNVKVKYTSCPVL